MRYTVTYHAVQLYHFIGNFGVIFAVCVMNTHPYKEAYWLSKSHGCINDTQNIGGPTLQEKGQLVQRSKDDEQVQLGPNLPRSKADEQVHLSM